MLRKQPAESGFGNSPFHRDDASTSGAHVAARGGSGGAPVATEDVGELEQEAPVDDIDEEREAGRKGKRKRVRSKDFNARRRAANLQKAVHKLAVEYDIPEEDIMSLTESGWRCGYCHEEFASSTNIKIKLHSRCKTCEARHNRSSPPFCPSANRSRSRSHAQSLPPSRSKSRRHSEPSSQRTEDSTSDTEPSPPPSKRQRKFLSTAATTSLSSSSSPNSNNPCYGALLKFPAKAQPALCYPYWNLHINEKEPWSVGLEGGK